MQRRRLADAAQADEARLAGLLQFLQRRRHLGKGNIDGELVAAVLGDQRIVQLEQVDMVAAHALQAVVHALCDRLTDICAMLGAEPHLGADDDIGLQGLQNAAEIPLGLAVAIERRGVEVVDAGVDGPCHCAFLVGRRTFGEQPADCTGAIAQHRHFKPGTSQPALLHLTPHRYGPCPLHCPL